MASFGWKRKSKLKTSVDIAFSEEGGSEDEDEEDIDWLHLVKRQRLSLLEDSVTKSKRLQDEGTLLAENDRYWEAIKYWDEAIQLTPTVAALHEMKAQALLELGELFPAVQSAERAVQLDPTWAVARQTLGRTQIGLGELKMALESFQKALHLLPTDQEIRDDLQWTQELLEQKSLLNSQSNVEREK